MRSAITGDDARPASSAEDLSGAQVIGDGFTPCSAAEAVSRAHVLLAERSGQYVLGTGDYRPRPDGDRPWSDNSSAGSDCAGFAISWCYKLRRHRPGFNRGLWATVADDLNCNSALEDAAHKRELFEFAGRPEPGDLLMYPTFSLKGSDGQLHRFIGHVGLVSSVGRVLEWDAARPQWGLLDIIHCCGPNGRTPAAVATDGHIWQHHDSIWPKPQHRSYLVRVRA